MLSQPQWTCVGFDETFDRVLHGSIRGDRLHFQ